MKKFLVCLICCIMLTACNRNEDVVVQHCGEYDIQIRFDSEGDILHANINGDDVELMHVVSASGARYAGVLNDVAVVLWNKGENWIFSLGDESIIECKAK